MQRVFQPYINFLCRPGMGKLFLLVALTRMPFSMFILALTMFLRSTTGNFTRAGLGIGLFSIAIAAMAPFIGRWTDRFGPHRPLQVMGWLQPLAMLGLYVAATRHAPFAIVLALVIASGLATPPIAPTTRTLWRHLFTTDDDRRMAFSLDSVITELNFTMGPALAGFIVAWVSPEAAFLVALVCNVVAVQTFRYTSVLEHWQHQHRNAERHWLGPLSDRTLVLYFVLTFGLVNCFGMFEVGYPAYALAMGVPGYAGLLLALNGFGSAVGGALFGVWQSPRSVEQQYAMTLTFLIVPYVLHALLPQPWAFIIVSFIGGFAIAPCVTSLNLLTSRRAPAKYAAEAQTWTATFIISGIGCGMAAAGYLLERWSIATMFWLGAAVVSSMALCAWLLQRQTTSSGIDV